MKEIVLFVAMVIGASGCFITDYTEITESNFYEFNTLAYDVVRLPLSYPYQLRSANCCSYWIIDGPLSDSMGVSMRIDGIHVQKDFISFKEYQEEVYHVFNSKDNITFNASSSTSYKELCMYLNMEDRIYFIDSVYAERKETGSLPWRKSN